MEGPLVYCETMDMIWNLEQDSDNDLFSGWFYLVAFDEASAEVAVLPAAQLPATQPSTKVRPIRPSGESQTDVVAPSCDEDVKFNLLDAWEVERLPGGDLRVSLQGDVSVVVSEKAGIRDRTVEYALFALATDLLSARMRESK